jgi:hypothetical protein
MAPRKGLAVIAFTIGYGHDAADVALTSNYGALELNAMKVTVEIAP